MLVYRHKPYYVPSGQAAEKELRRLLSGMGCRIPEKASLKQLYAIYFNAREKSPSTRLWGRDR